MFNREVLMHALAIVILCCTAGAIELALMEEQADVIFLRADDLYAYQQTRVDPVPYEHPEDETPNSPVDQGNDDDLGNLFAKSKTRELPTVSEYCSDGKCDLEGLNVVIFISARTAHGMWESGEAQIIDARNVEDYNTGHIEFATHLPVSAFQGGWPKEMEALMKELTTVVYCDGVACDSSKLVARNLVRAGYKQVRIIEGGLTQWRQAGYPVEVTQ